MTSNSPDRMRHPHLQVIGASPGHSRIDGKVDIPVSAKDE